MDNDCLNRDWRDSYCPEYDIEIKIGVIKMKLSKYEQELVADHYYLVKSFAGSRGINLDEFHGILCIGLCKAALNYDHRISKFSTCACKFMEQEYCNVLSLRQTDIRKANYQTTDRDIETISSEEVCKQNSIDTFAELGCLESILTPRQFEVATLLSQGLKQTDIANKLKKSTSFISQTVKEIKQRMIQNKEDIKWMKGVKL